MSSVELALFIGALALYTAVLFWALLWAIRGLTWMYRKIRPAPVPPREFDLEAGRDYRLAPEPGQPVFGPNAKPMLVQITAAVVMLVVIRTFFWDWVSPEAFGRYFCTMGLC